MLSNLLNINPKPKKRRHTISDTQSQRSARLSGGSSSRRREGSNSVSSQGSHKSKKQKKPLINI
jgi:hypothetical protein